MEIPDDIRGAAVKIYTQYTADRGWSLIDLIADELRDERERATIAERERCAKIAEQRYLASDQPSNFVANVRKFHGEDIAAAIRGA